MTQIRFGRSGSPLPNGATGEVTITVNIDSNEREPRIPRAVLQELLTFC
jgi:hypothetical protein